MDKSLTVVWRPGYWGGVSKAKDYSHTHHNAVINIEAVLQGCEEVQWMLKAERQAKAGIDAALLKYRKKLNSIGQFSLCYRKYIPGEL